MRRAEQSRLDDVPMPELEIQKIDRDLRNEKAKNDDLEIEKAEFELEGARLKKQLRKVEEIRHILERLGKEDSMGNLTLDSLAKCFSDLQNKYADEYKLCNLPYNAYSLGLPLFIRLFQGWDPLRDPFHGLDVVSLWKTLLQGEDFWLYTKLVLKLVLPAVTISSSKTWQAREPEPMLRFLDLWEMLLPPLVLHAILYHIVMPKLYVAVKSWEPYSHRETVPIHVWVHPWLPLLGHKLVGVYQIIRSKLSNANKEWYLGWKEVLSKKLLADEGIRYRLNRGLEIMNQVVEGFEVVNPGLKEKFNYLGVIQHRQFEAQQEAAQQAAGIGIGIVEMSWKEEIEKHTKQHGLPFKPSLKEFIENVAQQNWLLFKPKTGRMHNDHQVILDSLNQNVYAKTEETWSLISLKDLLDKHKTFLTKRL